MDRLDTNHKRFSLRLKTYWPYYLMVLPGVLYLFIFKYIPMFGSVIAFQDFSVSKGILGSKFVGFKQLKKLFN